ncbi:hypothetical protein Tco_1340342, partial [Tanacetum coccineum]
DAPEFQDFFEINELKAQLQAKNTAISNLKNHIATLKGKSVSDCSEQVHIPNVIAPEPAIALKPLDNALDYACKFTTRIQELLVYVSATCPSSRKESEKLVVVAPMNKNRPLLPSKGVKSSTNASRSKPMSNTRNNRISRTSSSNMKNKKVEDHPRNVKSSLNNPNHDSVCNANIKLTISPEARLLNSLPLSSLSLGLGHGIGLYLCCRLVP